MIIQPRDFPRDQRMWNINLVETPGGMPLVGYGFFPAPGRLFFALTEPATTDNVKRCVQIRLGPSPGPVFDALTIRECETDAEGYVHCLMDLN